MAGLRMTEEMLCFRRRDTDDVPRAAIFERVCRFSERGAGGRDVVKEDDIFPRDSTLFATAKQPRTFSRRSATFPVSVWGFVCLIRMRMSVFSSTGKRSARCFAISSA